MGANIVNEQKKARNLKVILAYDGSAYHGFQRQKNAVTIQSVLEDHMAVIFGHRIQLVASGRTDAKVHAYGQVVSFFTTGSIPTKNVVRAVNGLLPDDIVIQSVEEVEPKFHARYSAKMKTYLYRVHQGQIADPFMRMFAWHIQKPLDLDSMQEALQYIIGLHDFSSFQAAGSVQVQPVRTIYIAQCCRAENQIQFLFTGNGFLYHMVRNLVGTVVNVGSGRINPAAFKKILEGRDRSQAGMTAPPQGLYLKEVTY